MRLIDMVLITGAIALFVVVNAKEAPPSNEWQLTRGGSDGTVHFRIDRRHAFGRMSTSRDVPWERFQGLKPEDLTRGGALKFEFATDPGTLVCTGQDRLGRASGTFTFRPNPAFASELRTLGYAGNATEQELFDFALHGVTLELARALPQAGQVTTFQDLREVAVHGVTGEYIREVRALGYTKLAAADFAKARIHGVDTVFLRELKAAGYDLPMERMTELKIHGISPEYLRQLKSYGLRPDARELTELKIHGVSPEFLKALADTGHATTPVREVVELKIHGVSPEFLRETAKFGYQFTNQELAQLRIHGVDGRYLQRLADSGYKNLGAEKIVQLKIHGID